ncbi:MAG: pentapeptide repeat-containing protein [Aquabacterium sp.]
MKLEDLKNRWHENQLLKEVREECISNQPPRGISQRDWYEQFTPKEIHPYSNKYCADLRGIDFNQVTFGEGYWFTEARLDNASFAKAKIHSANFQHAVLIFADFSSSELISASFSPVYAHGANFERARIERSHFAGWGPIRMGGEYVTNLSSTNFQNCITSKTDFGSTDFRRADFRGAHFIDCKFRNSDLRAIVFDEHTRFIRCDFHSAFIDEYFPYINAFRKGMYDTVQAPENMDRVNWIQGIGLPGRA